MYDQEQPTHSQDTKETLLSVRYLREKNNHIGNLLSKKNGLFNKMKFMLDCGFNLLVYGVGSKLDLMNLFVQLQIQGQANVLIFNAYHQGCNMKRIIDDIVSWVLREVYKNQCHDRKVNFPKNVNMHEQVLNIKRALTKNKSLKPTDEMIDQNENYTDFSYVPNTNEDYLYIVIHSMDAGSLKTEDVQTCLAELASIEQIQLIVTVDNIHSTRMWNDTHLDKFNWYS